MLPWGICVCACMGGCVWVGGCVGGLFGGIKSKSTGRKSMVMEIG